MAAAAKVRLSDPRHLMRFLKFQGGMTHEEIAKQEHVSISVVKASVTQIEVYRNTRSREEMELSIRDLVISTIPSAKKTLEGLLEATELVEVKNQKTGQQEIKTVEDKTTRLEAMRIVNTLVTALQPKVPLIQQQTNTQIVATATISRSETNEERMARIREKAKAFNALPPQIAAVPDYIDAGEEFDGGDDDDGDDEEYEDEEEE